MNQRDTLAEMAHPELSPVEMENSSTATTPVDSKPISVFDFDDYHVFLREWCAQRRHLRTSFSFQELANRAGMKSRSFLRKVTLGEKDLLHSSALRLAEAMGLSYQESGYFLALVGFNNASDPMERNLYLKMLRSIPRPAHRRILSAQEFDLFAKWYVAVVLEMVSILPFGNDFKKLAGSLNPAITPDEARHALQILLDLELIRPDGEKYAQTSKVLHTREHLVSRAIKNYQRETMELAIRALDAIPPEERRINTLTMGLDAEGWEAACQLVQEYRQKLIDLGSSVSQVDRVVQFNLQVFPVGASREPR